MNFSFKSHRKRQFLRILMAGLTSTLMWITCNNKQDKTSRLHSRNYGLCDRYTVGGSNSWSWLNQKKHLVQARESSDKKLERCLVHLADSNQLFFLLSGPHFSGTDWSGMRWLEDPAWLGNTAAGSSVPAITRSLEDLSVRVEEQDNRRWTVDGHLCEPDR